mmetsp:Transcript_18727/g.34957  ORF Transcript_18727/g.34957 Transcript_18727/m.34957 type:complete len:510 (+) Transcript_18727:52-1581(+)
MVKLNVMNVGFILCIVVLPCSNAFVWQVDEELVPLQTLTFSERHMFGTNEGPVILPNKRATIFADLQFDLYLRENRTTGFQYAVYLPDDDHRYTGIGLCNDDPFSYNWARNIQQQMSFTSYKGARRLTDGTTEYHYVGHIHHRYQVFEEGWHNIDIQTCTDSSIYLSSSLAGEVIFKNPYGYVPGEQWGIIPFETVRAAVTTALAVMYGVLCYIHRDGLLPLHKAVFVALVVCAVSAILWCAAFITINSSGHPFCCPFPPVVSAAQLVQILRQTLARLLLLVVSLGYGIIRPKLQRVEWAMVGLVTVFYFVAALSYQITDIVFFDVHPNSQQVQSKTLLYPALLADFVFLAWIYLAMSSTIRILNEFKQTHKLEMYDNLWITIGIFVTQFLVVSIIMSLNSMGYIEWPWQWDWCQQAAWEMVNFSIIVGVAVICRPTSNSNLLSYASQLPMEDPDDDFDEEDGVEMSSGRGEGSGGGGRGQNQHEFGLPDADDDDEEFGLDDSEDLAFN